MLDVHAPDHKMHGVKDFLLHIFTITVGLLIALGLEGCVERYHKAELRREAEANLRQEIQDNAKELKEWQPVMRDEVKTLTRALDFITARKKNEAYDVTGMGLGFEMRSLSDASWRTASATGALGLMDYKQVQAYAGVYQVQDEAMRLEHEALDDFLRMQSYAVYGFDPAKFSPADAAAAEPEVRRALAHVKAMLDVSSGLQEGYGKALAGK